MDYNKLKYSRGQQIVFAVLACFIIICFVTNWSILKFHSQIENNFAPDSILLSNISSFSTAPMQTVTVLGVVMLAISVIFGVWALIDKIVGRALEGMTTVIIITIFIGSIIMISLGVIGYYIARIYEEIKGRPRYIISSSVRSKKRQAVKK